VSINLIRVTATSILYGACREMIANFTARSLHGILSLPSISFRKPKTETQACEFGSDHLIQENTREQPTLLPITHDQCLLFGTPVRTPVRARSSPDQPNRFGLTAM
jgi:hypothetical protein